MSLRMMASSGSAVEVRHGGDTEFRVSMRGHEMVVDLPLEAGGGDAGPGPTQLLVASLASSVAFFGRGYLHARGLPDEVNVCAQWWSRLVPSRVVRVEVAVEAPGLPGSKRAEFRDYVERCAVRNAFRDPPEIDFEIVACGDTIPDR